MAGASLPHNYIVSNLIVKIGGFLRGKPCNIAASFTYPDATIICGKPEMIDSKMDTVKNPIVIIEVMNPSTEQIDRGAKFFNYMQIPTLQEYLLISSTSVFSLSARKQADNSWKFEELKNLTDRPAIQSIEHEIALEEILRKCRVRQSAGALKLIHHQSAPELRLKPSAFWWHNFSAVGNIYQLLH
jgi:Uma2 family endonuclease